jgi:hypothetical protein
MTPHVKSKIDWRECDRVNEAFKARHGRYATLEECLRLWPQFYKV